MGDGELCGYVGLGGQNPVRPEGPEVDNLALVPSAQRLGLFAVFVRVCDRIAWTTVRSRQHLYAHVTMVENVELYRSVGFGDIGQVEECGSRRLCMTRPGFSVK